MYPALVVARTLSELYPAARLVFVGARGDMARDLVDQAAIRFDAHHEVLAGPLHGVSLPRKITSLFKLVVGLLQSLGLVLRLRPHALFLTGGWVGFPAAVACWLLRRPVVVYVPDIEPGLTLRVVGRRVARVIAATVPDTERYFRGKRVVVTGYPLREALRQTPDRAAACAALALDPARRVLLVTGGSRGARGINEALWAAAPDLLGDGVQILHITGKLDYGDLEARHARLNPEQRADYRLFPYRSDIELCFAAADVVISRGGASSLAEYPQFGLPSILVPYPYAWRYQKVNADYLADRGAAIRLDQEQLAASLLPTVRDLLRDPARLAAMRAAAESLRQVDGAANIARLIAEVAGHPDT